MKQKLFTLLLTIAVIFTMCFSAVPAYAADKQEGTPISTLDELKAMENNPSGKYYLTADIKIPEGFTLFKNNYPNTVYFSGTLDGNGHKLIGYTVNHTSGEWYQGALFEECKGAKFKNLTMTDVDIYVKSDKGAFVGVLAGECFEGESSNSFSNITLEGDIYVSGSSTENDYRIGGLAYYLLGSVSSCKSKLNITADVKAGTYWGADLTIGGLAAFLSNGPVKSSRNYGDITVNGFAGGTLSVNGICGGSSKFTSTKNTGDIIVNVPSDAEEGHIVVSGVSDGAKGLSSCYNTGKITVKSSGYSDSIAIAGVASESVTVYKCYNKGAISFSGKARDGEIGGVVCRGATGNEKNISLTYNKGKITATTDANMKMGGIAAETYGMKNCYNTGTVTLNQEGKDSMVGGLAGNAALMGGTVTCNYNTGKITASSQYKGSLLGTYEGADVVRKRNIYNNYYSGSTKAYGASYITWKDWTAKATKVSAITASNCPKLSSKTWTYNKDKKRLILKDNKEK